MEEPFYGILSSWKDCYGQWYHNFYDENDPERAGHQFDICRSWHDQPLQYTGLDRTGLKYGRVSIVMKQENKRYG